MLNHYGKLIFIDLETTGPNPLTDRITEIGIVEVSDSGVQRWSTLVNPEMPIPPFIRQLTGIDDDMVRDAPRLDMLREELLQRLDDGLFIAHNARFDYGFLRHAFRRFGTILRCEVLCTVKLSRKLFPEEAKHSLDALVERHKLSPQARHRALADADLLWQFWRRLEATLPADELLGTIRQLLHRPNLPVHLDPDLLDDLPDGAGVYVFYGEHDVPLHVGRATHLRQRVLSHFHAEHPSYKDQRLARQVRRIEWHETAGEVGAQLLHADLSRRLQPVHDCAPRKSTELCSWQLRRDAANTLRPVLVFASDVDFGRTEGLHGLFNSPDKAQAALHALAERHGLCMVALGLESRAPCSADFAHACGGEDLEQHAQRLIEALAPIRLQAWAYGGPVAMVEAGSDGRHDLHVVNNWHSLGIARDEGGIAHLLDDAPRSPAFDVECYKILSRALSQGKLQVRAVGFADMVKMVR